MEQEKLEKIGLVTLDGTWYAGEDLYSDGDVEEELLDIVKTYPEEAYSQVIRERKSWPVLYHLSHLRGNIVRYLPLEGTERVLEIGAGCGAVTGTLAGKAGHVTCIDLSRRRCRINAWRNRQRDNLDILVGNFEDIAPHLTEQYDLVTLIGVFEYAAWYLSLPGAMHSQARRYLYARIEQDKYRLTRQIARRLAEEYPPERLKSLIEENPNYLRAEAARREENRRKAEMFERERNIY